LRLIGDCANPGIFSPQEGPAGEEMENLSGWLEFVRLSAYD
jgi:hypothetical protein